MMILDLIFLAIFIYAAYRGYKKGFLLQAATLAILILGIFGAVKFSGNVSALIMEKTGANGEYLPVLSFAITFILIVVCIHFLTRVIEKLLDRIALTFLNRIVGILFNLIKYAFIISAVLVIIDTINRKANIFPEEKLNQSRLYHPLSSLAPALFPYLTFEFTHPQDAPDEPEEEPADDELLV